MNIIGFVFFKLPVGLIKLSLLPINNYCRFLCISALLEDDYFIAGRATAVALVHGGRAPRCLSRRLFQALVTGPESVRVPFDEMPKGAVKDKLDLVIT